MKLSVDSARIAWDDRVRFNALFLLEHYLPDNQGIRRRKHALRHRIANDLRQKTTGKPRPVERVRSISERDFRRDYLAKGIPLVIEGGAKSWPLASWWSFDNFRSRYGDASIKLVQRKGVAPEDDLVDGKEFSEELRFDTFLDQLLSGGGKYMRFSPLLERFPELLDDFNHEFFRKMSNNNWGVTYQLFMGGTGTFTPLHNAITSFFFVNVCGVKRWSLIPNHYLPVLDPAADGFGYNHSKAQADLSNVGDFPGLERIERLEAVMEAGDILYCPSWMWHSVKNDSPTIGIRCGFIYPRGMIQESPTLAFIRFVAARNQPLLKSLYYALFKPDLPDRDKWLLTSKLIRR